MKFERFLWWGVCLSAPSWSMYLNETKVLEISISKSGLTRLSVEGDPIQDVFVHPAELTHNVQLHKSGHVFLTLEGIEKPVFATVMTESGKAQDLKLIATAGKNTGPVILRVKTATPPPVSLVVPSLSIEEVLKNFLKGKIAAGFTRVEREEVPRLLEELVFEPKGTYSNGTYRVVRFEAKNESSQDLILSQDGCRL